MFALAAWIASLTAPVHAELLRIGLPHSQFAALPGLVGEVALLSLCAGALLALGRLHLGMLLVGVSAFVMTQFATRLDVIKSREASQQHVAEAVRGLMPGGVDMYAWQTFEDADASLLMYGLSPLRVIDSHSADLWFGCAHAGAASPCVAPQALLQARAEGRAVAVWVGRERLAGFLASGLADGMQALNFKHCVVFFSRRTAASIAPTAEKSQILP
jgi:hypothetical protein